MMTLLASITPPRLMFGAAVALAGSAILLAGVASRSDVGAARLSEPAVSYSVDLRFDDAPDGGIRVTALSGAPRSVVLAPGQDGFVRVALRSLARERRIIGQGPEQPFRLGRQDDGRIWLRDLATGRLLYLDAYGHTNAQAFARLIQTTRSAP